MTFIRMNVVITVTSYVTSTCSCKRINTTYMVEGDSYKVGL